MAAYKRQVLLDAVNRLVVKDKQYKELPKRITRDDHLVKVTSKWVRLSINITTNFNHLFIDRLSHRRGHVYSHLRSYCIVLARDPRRV